MKKLGIIGCGWLGYRMAQHLHSTFEIHTTVTKSAKIADLNAAGFHPEVVNFDGGAMDPWSKLDQLDAIIITVSLFSRSVDEQTLTIRRANLINFISGYNRPIIMMSSTGVYKNKTGVVTEQSVSSLDVSGEREMYLAFPQVTILRLGGLMGDDRQLKRYKINDQDSPVNHVHFEDVINVVQKLLEVGSSSKVYNVVAPLHPTKASVISSQMGVAEDLPTAKEGKIVRSEKLISELNYTFLYPDPAKFD